MARGRWTVDQWRAWQAQRLRERLAFAAESVPFYRAIWREGIGGRRSWADLSEWPLLEKDSVREFPRSFIPAGYRCERMFPEHTSGTTGKPLQLWWSREAVRGWYALFEARLLRANGLSGQSRWANLGGQLVVPVARRKPPFWVWNPAMRQLYMSSYHLTPATAPLYLNALRRYRISYLVGYPSSLYEFSRLLLDLNLKGEFLVALTNAEPLLPHQRRAISAGLGCRVLETYGMAEIVAAASECALGRMHTWPEVGVIEVVNAGEDGVGELVCTGLLNDGMPLIRYRTGDMGRLRPSSSCTCGNSAEVLEVCEGRADDVLLAQNGRRIGRLDPVFKADLPIVEAQIVQESLELLRVVVVAGKGYDERTEDSIRSRIRDRLGPVDIVIERVNGIPREKNGKFRAVVSKVQSK